MRRALAVILVAVALAVALVGAQPRAASAFGGCGTQNPVSGSPKYAYTSVWSADTGIWIRAEYYLQLWSDGGVCFTYYSTVDLSDHITGLGCFSCGDYSAHLRVWLGGTFQDGGGGLSAAGCNYQSLNWLCVEQYPFIRVGGQSYGSDNYQSYDNSICCTSPAYTHQYLNGL